MGNRFGVVIFAGGRRSVSDARARLGFTLLEIVAVLLLIGVLTIVAVNRISNDTDAIVEADALRSALRYAQSRAMADVYTWGIVFSSGSYRVFGDNPNVTAILPGQGGDTRNLPSDVSMGWSLATGNTVYFNWRGQPVTSAIVNSSDAQNPATVSQTITLTQSGHNVVVTITPYTGFVP